MKMPLPIAQKLEAALALMHPIDFGSVVVTVELNFAHGRASTGAVGLAYKDVEKLTK